jgi:hypothetical protein
MAIPNRALAMRAKRPFEFHDRTRHEWLADDIVRDLQAQGFDAKKTRFNNGSRRYPIMVWNVWRRPKAS